MGANRPIRRLSEVYLGSITNTTVLSVTTAESLFTIGSGNRAFEVTNYSSVDVYYGQSGVLVASGGLLASRGSKFWDQVIDNFSMFFVSASAGITSAIIIQEYQGHD